MPGPMLLEADDIPQAWKILVPAYKSCSYRPLVLKINRWERKYGEKITGINLDRLERRCASYLDSAEIDRVAKVLIAKGEASIRFGVEKIGRGYHGERGDFCLVGGSVTPRKLTLFYRSLELIGGFAYDLAMINVLQKMLPNTNWKELQIFSDHANVFALKRNSNEKLYPKLVEIFNDRAH